MAVLACLLAVFAGPSKAQEPILIRFAHVVGENTPKGKGAEMFKQRVEQRLEGRVKVEIYPRSEKFDDDEVFSALLFGDVEMAAPSFSKFRSYAPVLKVFDLPFLFEDVDHVHRFQQGVTGQQLLQAMLPVGIVGLAYWDNGMRAISANKPLRVPSDAEGLVFRIEPSDVIQQQYARIGVVGLPMPFKRVVDAIKEGLVEGQENSWSNIYSLKIQTLLKNFTELNHSFQGYMVITGQDFWDDLPTDIRSELQQILAEVTVEVNKLAQEQAITDRAKVESSPGVQIIIPSVDELALWRDKMVQVWMQFEPEIGNTVIESAVAAGEQK
jgi:C4-dicarboxylate-binding protein DctP